jgi:HK97 family phage major capsid protein
MASGPGGLLAGVRMLPMTMEAAGMARKYAYAAPVKPDDLADLLMDPGLAARFGNSPSELFASYAERAMAADPALAVQLADQLRPSARRPALQSATAVRALNRADAPGAGLYDAGEFTLGSFFRAAHHGRPAPAGRARLEQLRNAYGSEAPADGGYLIPEELRSEIVFAALSLGVIRQRARVFPVTTLRTGLPVIDDSSHAGASGVLGGFVAYWTEEGAELVESSAGFGRQVADVKKLTALANTPNELMADAPAWEIFLQEAVPQGFAYFEDLAYLTGDGVGSPLGMISCPASISVPAQSGQGSATIVWENIVAMAARMLPTSLNRAVWLAASDTFTELAGMAVSVGTGGGPVWTAAGGLSIFGRPVWFYDFMPKLGTTGDIAFVDPAYYGIADRAVLQIASSPHPKFAMDVTTWRMISRQDARPLLQSPLTPRNGASGTLSAFTQIAARP